MFFTQTNSVLLFYQRINSLRILEVPIDDATCIMKVNTFYQILEIEITAVTIIQRLIQLRNTFVFLI